MGLWRNISLKVAEPVLTNNLYIQDIIILQTVSSTVDYAIVSESSVCNSELGATLMPHGSITQVTWPLNQATNP